MATPFPIQQQWLGMDSDSPHDQMPPGMSRGLGDLVPGLSSGPYYTTGTSAGAALSLRGQMRPVSDLNAVTYGTCFDGLAWAPFSTNPGLYSVGQNAHLFSGGDNSGNASILTDLGSLGFLSAQMPVYFNNALVQFANDGVTAPKTYDTTNGILAMGGTPPACKYGCVFKGRLVAAAPNSSSTSVYFAPVGWGPNGVGGNWDTTNATTTTASPVTGLAAVGTSVLVFHAGSVERLRGTIPLGTTNSDMVLEPLFAGVGTQSARSITAWRNNVIWADARGVYMTDGASLTDLTEQFRVKRLWLDKMAGFTALGLIDSVACGIYQDKLLASFSLKNGSGYYSDHGTVVFDLVDKFAYGFSQVVSRGFALALDGTNELYSAWGKNPQVVMTSRMWGGSGGQDGSDAVSYAQPGWESTFYRGWQRFHRKWIPSMGRQRWNNIYITYEYGSGPGVRVQLATDPSDSNGTIGAYPYTLSSSLPKGVSYSRIRLPVRLGANGLSLNLSNTPNLAFSTDTFRIFAIEADYWPEETSRL